ncbi:MAG: hypothetical protein AB1757_08530 [Acidobacteriota bacterium]
MQEALLIKGRLTSPTTVELEEPVLETTNDVEVVLRLVRKSRICHNQPVFEFLQQLPEGKRTKEEIDAQIREERDAWDNGQ